MPKSTRTRLLGGMTFAIATALIAVPIFAQQNNRPSRQCIQEVRALCGGDRAQMRSCLAQRSGELSDRCAGELRERFQQRRGSGQAAEQTVPGTTLSYGQHELQKIDFYAAPVGASADAGVNARVGAPLIIYVHGGGWKRGDKSASAGSSSLAHWHQQGFAVASINYRLVPDNTVEDQGADLAAAIAHLRGQGEGLRIDPQRIVLVGHSAGAHLVALVGTDPSYLAAQDLTQSALAGVVALDGAGYWVPDQMGENARVLGDTYTQAFGTDRARQERLSPTHHAAAPNAPEFLILHVDREDAARQSAGLGEALQAAGTDAEVARVAGRGLTGHREINQRLGEPDYPATALVDAFLARVLR